MITLSSPIESAPKIHKKIVPALKRLGIKTVRDLLFHFPSRYDDFSDAKKIAEAAVGETVTVEGAIIRASAGRTLRKRMTLLQAVVEDESGRIAAVWFNQPFLAQTIKTGARLRLSGKVAQGPKGIYLQNPAHEKIPDQESGIRNHGIHTGGLIPIYPETSGITSRWLRFLINSFIGLASRIPDALPEDTRTRHSLLTLGEAIRAIHFPRTRDEAAAAQRRFMFEDLLQLQLHSLRERSRMKQSSAPAIATDTALIKRFAESLPFSLTDAQRRSIWEILKDIERPRPMNRLLEGDVGSGKTVVAAAAALLAVRTGYRVAFMAPTEILARQHFATLSKVLAPFDLKVGLMIGAGKKKRPADADVIVGTHALIQKNVRFEKLGLVVVDEQHRFGVNQRAALVRGQTRTELARTDADRLLYEDLTYKIRGCIFKVKGAIGGGHKELIYQEALAQALTEAGIRFDREKRIPVTYGNKQVGIYQPDFVVENKVIVELKALPFIGSTEVRQAWNYIKGTPYPLMLFVNFGPKGAEIRRIIYESKRSPRKSALAGESPRQSALWIPHLLSMSATPIPRTLALTIYADLDLSVLDEMPPTRKQVVTRIVEPGRRQETYQFIREETGKGRQAFVICPKIGADDENSKFQIPNSKFAQQRLLLAEVKSVKAEYKKLSEDVFPDLKVAMLHGKMKSKEKDAVMKKFRDRAFDLLVSTSVIEVGVDVPNATIMMIEGAERFGLAQLHQFRGRVGRGAEQSYCFLFPTEDGQATRRLRALAEAKSGFELAEEDLKIRGPGELFGTRQSGVSDLALKGITDPELVREVRREAAALVTASADLSRFRPLRARLDELERSLHLE